jgi:ribosomal RNA-processing protein 7
MALPEQISGYFPVPIKVGGSKDVPIYHIIYVRKHHSQNKAEDSTVFAVNLPLDTTHECLKHLCQSLGGVNAKEFQHSYGHRWQIVLVDKSACNRFLSKAKAQTYNSDPIIWPTPSLSGSQLYLQRHLGQYIDQDDLQDRVDEDMERFSQAEEQKQQELEQMANKVDDDGFTMVVGSKTKDRDAIAPPPKMTQDEALRASKKHKKNKEKTDFYRFQLREQKKNEMNNLLRRFQQDKEKVKELREKRRFKPY